ncbi:MAG TPA: Asp-tRNA(Asn)/Glu-tRNA(Gln) amidotransferase subunit GatC [Planctomycetaceae bacterium]|nr:Asp-tRNA(Asn)/Glu-tRNA(Gln) amidotransferase subunit GatC [Planctomycetaceae bacterium]
MPRLTRDEVRKVARLARLKLGDDELDRFTTQLGQVLDYVGVLGELDTEDVEPMAHAVEVTDVWREDVVSPSLAREMALANAPRSDGRFFLVPPILD